MWDKMKTREGCVRNMNWIIQEDSSPWDVMEEKVEEEEKEAEECGREHSESRILLWWERIWLLAFGSTSGAYTLLEGPLVLR